MSETNERITMAAVAKQAGVHTTTVSLALRNHPSLPDSTRRRLQALAEKMGYQPDPALRALVAWRRQSRPKKESPPLAYLTRWDAKLSWKRAPAHAEFFAGATSKARKLGYRLEHFWLGEPLLTPQRMSGILRARGITGVLIASYLPASDRPLDLDWSRFSAVKIDYFPRQPELHTVTNDQRAIMQLAVRRIIAAGYRRIGFVLPLWWDQCAERAWSAGFLAEQQAVAPEERIPIFGFSGIPEFESTVSRTGVELLSNDALAQWLKQYRPEVLIGHGRFVLPHLAAIGLAVPRDLAFVEMYLEPNGRAAGVRHNCARVGELAVEILAGQLQQYAWGIPPFPTTTLVEGTWFDGDTLPPRRAPAARAGRPAAGARTGGRSAGPKPSLPALS